MLLLALIRSAAKKEFILPRRMSREKSRTSNALAAAHEKFLQLCADKAVELQRKERKPICEQVIRALKSRYEDEIASL